jgi:hypothetical protein
LTEAFINTGVADADLFMGKLEPSTTTERAGEVLWESNQTAHG